VVNDEGLCSSKAIAFISSRGNPYNPFLNEKKFRKISPIPHEKWRFFNQEFCLVLRSNVIMNIRTRCEKWKK